MSRMAKLVLGPLLRYVGQTEATVWVETDEACEVEVLGRRARTFHVFGHHYALVALDELEPASVIPYTVSLDGHPVWPEPGDERPGCAIHTRAGERRSRLVFGSCRVGAPEREPYTLAPADHPDGVGIDALWVYARRLQAGAEPWPDGLMMLGDQVYADEVSPETMAFIRARRSTDVPPGEEIADFEEYTRLYAEAWTDPDVRWLLATVPSLMIFDDHDVIDDWNISWEWVQDMRRTPWWEDRIVGAFMAYWIYQHLGNLAPPELAQEALYRDVRAAADAGPLLRGRAHQADRESAADRWAFHRDYGRSRVLVVDSRAARVLADGRRDMVDDDEWEWIRDHGRGDFDHLVIVSSLPVFLSYGVHYLEGWNEAVCAGAWGAPARWVAERIRRALDLEHWPAFQLSFERMMELLREVSNGREGYTPPASVTLVGGDVHNAYVAEVSLGRSDPGRSHIHQLVCSPFRNPLPPAPRRVLRLGWKPAAARPIEVLARLAGVRRPSVRWRRRSGPTFENSIGILELDGRRAEAAIYRSVQDDPRGSLESLHTCVLSEGPRAGD
jgi:hypothetical protein